MKQEMIAQVYGNISKHIEEAHKTIDELKDKPNMTNSERDKLACSANYIHSLDAIIVNDLNDRARKEGFFVCL